MKSLLNMSVELSDPTFRVNMQKQEIHRNLGNFLFNQNSFMRLCRHTVDIIMK